MIPDFVDVGGPWRVLPPGVHDATMEEIKARFATSDQRHRIFSGFRNGVTALREAGCRKIFLDGSFVTEKPMPADFDACWDPVGVDVTNLNPVFLDFSGGRKNQKRRFYGEFFPVNLFADGTHIFLDFFKQTNTRERRKVLSVYTCPATDEKDIAMITNERQYRITKAQIEKFKTAIGAFDVKAATEQTKSKALAKAELAAMQSEFEQLSKQLHEYEALKSGIVEVLKAPTLEDLPTILIRARIAKGLSQRQLAEALGLKEQQVQRYEAEEYASANLQRVAEVANALDLNISEVAEFRTMSQAPLVIDKDDLAWDQFPVKEMYRRNWFEGFSGSLEEAVANAEELVREFVQGSIGKPVQTLARQRVRLGGIVNRWALLAWQCRIIRLAKKEAKKVTIRYRQKAITNEWLSKLAHGSIQKDGPREAIDYLRNSGIRFVIEPHLPQTHLDGAALLLSDGPIVGLTIRYDRLDNFWFVLFHELVHIVKHLHKGDVESIFDDLDVEAEDIEQEADEQAGEILVPEDKWNTALARYLRSTSSIIDFASELGIHPAIVAGKIRREAKNYTILTEMVGQGEVRKLFPDVHFS